MAEENAKLFDVNETRYQEVFGFTDYESYITKHELFKPFTMIGSRKLDFSMIFLAY